jgi:hypothetical protein
VGEMVGEMVLICGIGLVEWIWSSWNLLSWCQLYDPGREDKKCPGDHCVPPSIRNDPMCAHQP